jgi:hypothetical protein
MKYLNAITGPGLDPRLIQKLAAQARSALHRRGACAVSASEGVICPKHGNDTGRRDALEPSTLMALAA